MNNSEYWRNRASELENIQHSYSQEAYVEIEKIFINAQRDTQKEIEAWYGRLAKNNQVSITEARKLLSANELAEFKWDVKEYIKYGKENAINKAWIKELENASAKYHISRLEALQIRTQQYVEKAFGNELDVVDRLIKKSYTDGYYRTMFGIQKGFNVGFDVNGIDEKTLKNIVGKPWALDGKNFSDRIWASKQDMINELHSQLTRTCVLGKSPDGAINAISKKFDVSKNRARTLVQTEQAYFSSVARKDAFKELDVEEYEILATLDSRTSKVCQELDNKVFSMNDFEVGVTAPPFHPNCRSTTIPYFDDEYGVGKRAARGEDGKTYYVDSDMSYETWKKGFVDGDKSGIIEVDIEDKVKHEWQGLKYKSNYTKDEAIEHLDKTYGIQFKDSKRYPIDTDLLNDCVGWMDSFNNQYNGFINKSPCKIPIINNQASSKMNNTIGYYSYYPNSGRVVELAINGYYHSNPTEFRIYIERAVSTKWYPQNATMHKTFVHEFGHHVSNSMSRIVGDLDWQSKFIDECIQEFKKAEPKYLIDTYEDMTDYVSAYASTKEGELFAEAFAEYFGGEKPRMFAKIFGNKLDKILKEVN